MTANLDRLYARIPAVRGCRTGCSDCCGPVPMLEEESAALPTFLKPERVRGGMVITPTKAGCMDCAYSTPAGCSVYQHRPLMCRLFGAVRDEPRLRCPHGAHAKRPLGAAEARELVNEYMTLVQHDGVPT